METLPLQFVAPVVDVKTEENRTVPSVTLGGHGRIARIKVEEAPINSTLKKDYVEVQVVYCGLSFTDNYLRLGIIRNVKFPVIMGSECCGVVLRVGQAVTDLKPWQKVLCLKMQGGLFRRVVQVPRKHCFLVPEKISLNDAIGLGLNYLVAHVCLFDMGCVKDEDVVFMQSIAGGVGTAVTQLCQTLKNVQVLGTASESKFADITSHGVKRVFRHEEDYVQEILKDYPEGVDIIINSNGGTDIEKCFKMLKRCGTLVLIGSNSTAIYPKTTTWGMIRPIWDAQTVSSAELIHKNHTVAGVNIGLLLETHPEMMQAMVAKMFDLRSREKIEPRIHTVLPFEKVADGITQLCERQNYGKIILEVELETTTSDEPDQPVAEASETQALLAREEPSQVDAQEANGAKEEPKQESAVTAEPVIADQEGAVETSEKRPPVDEHDEQPKQPEEKIAEEVPKEVGEPQ